MVKPPSDFSMLRACFLLFAAVVLVQTAWVTAGVLGCLGLILTQEVPLGACADLSMRAREVMSEMIAGILALLIAARSDPPPPPPDP
jgi:hypothetical protein